MLIKFIVILVCFLRQCYPVVQQSYAGEINLSPNTITQFTITGNRYHSVTNIGLLAHNDVAGKDFYSLDIGNKIVIYKDDGSRQTFEIDEIHPYQAITVNYFLSLLSGKYYTGLDIFKQYYEGGDLTLQTCIEKNGIYTWGRLFIHAKIVSKWIEK